MAKATELFGGGLSAFDKAEAKAAANAKKQEALAAIAKRATTLFENFKNTLIGFAVSLRGPIDFARRLIDMFSLMNEEQKGAIGRAGLLAGAISMVSSRFGPIGLLGSLVLIRKHWGNVNDPNSIAGMLGPGGVKIFKMMGNGLKELIMEIPKLLHFLVKEVAKLWTDVSKSPEWQDFQMSVMIGLSQMFKVMTPILKEIFVGMIAPAIADSFVVVGNILAKDGSPLISGLGKIMAQGGTALGEGLPAGSTAMTAAEQLKRVNEQKIATARMIEASERAQAQIGTFQARHSVALGGEGFEAGAAKQQADADRLRADTAKMLQTLEKMESRLAQLQGYESRKEIRNAKNDLNQGLAGRW